MATIVKFQEVSYIGSLFFETSDGEDFEMVEFKNGIMILEVMAGTSIQSFAESIAGCFEEGSNFKGLKAIKFTFNGADITVTPENSTTEKILEQWTQKMEENHIKHMKTPEYAAKLGKKKKTDTTRKAIINEVIHIDKTTEMEFKDIVASTNWDKFVSNSGNNSGIVSYARQWAKYMQYKLSQGAKLIDIADSTSHNANIYDLSGSIYPYVVSILSQYWKYGEELFNWYNNKNNYSSDGVTNPSILNN
ncbi:MAG: hypothetical protein RR290_03280 [Clostridia bacterium]